MKVMLGAWIGCEGREEPDGDRDRVVDLANRYPETVAGADRRQRGAAAPRAAAER